MYNTCSAQQDSEDIQLRRLARFSTQEVNDIGPLVVEFLAHTAREVGRNLKTHGTDVRWKEVCLS